MIKDILEKARALISKEGSWIQGAAAIKRSGLIVEPTSEDAVCWCPAGAIYKVADGDESIAMAAINHLSSSALGGRRVDSWNDSLVRTHPEVLDAFDKAIALLHRRNDENQMDHSQGHLREQDHHQDRHNHLGQ